MKIIIYLISAIASILLIWFGYYTISPLFRHNTIIEEIPANQTVEKEASTSMIIGTTGHPASGIVRVIHTGDTNYLRYEKFETVNGPDLFIYLAKDLEAKEYVDLGRLRATKGDINYEIPSGVDVSQYRYAMVWCKQFSVLFNYAEINPEQ